MCPTAQSQKDDVSPGLGSDPRDAVNRVPSPTAIAAYFEHCIVWPDRFGVLGENDVWDGVFIETPHYFAQLRRLDRPGYSIKHGDYRSCEDHPRKSKQLLLPQREDRRPIVF